jgi:hypothetical protein
MNRLADPGDLRSGVLVDESNARLPRVPLSGSTGQTSVPLDDTAAAVAFDADGDGDLDILVINRRQSSFGTPGPDFVPYSYLLVNQGSPSTPELLGSFVMAPESQFPRFEIVGERGTAADFARRGDLSEDINGDGHVSDAEILNFNNIVKALRRENPDVAVLSRPEGTYVHKAVELQRPEANTSSAFLTRRAPRYVDLTAPFGEFNQVLDVIVVTSQGTDLYLSNDGSGSFENLALDVFLNPTLEPFYDISVGDVDLDGWLDFVVAANTGQFRQPSARLFINRQLQGLPAFQNVTNEIPEPGSTRFVGNTIENDGRARAVELFDADNDGDLDLFVGESGRSSGVSTFSGLNAFYENRIIGAGFSRRVGLGLVQAPGGGVVTNPGLAVSLVSPQSGRRGQSLNNVRVFGRGFRVGAQVSFGTGITVSNVRVRGTGIIDVDLVIRDTALLGGRTVTVVDPVTGGTATSNSGAFIVLDQSTTTPGEGGLPGGGNTSVGNDWILHQ